MFHHNMSMILLRDGVDGKKGIWMTISIYIEKSCDHVKKSMMEANHLKILIS